MSNKYRIIDDFQAGSTEYRVLVLDRDFESFEDAPKQIAAIGGKEYKFSLNSVRSWVIIKAKDSFSGEDIVFK